MTSILVRAGDTFETLARRAYGDEQFASLIQQSNPGVNTPVPGTVLVTPPNPNAPILVPSQLSAATPNETSILVDGKRFRFWSELTLTRSIDAMDTLEFVAPFDHENVEFRETFRPFSYKPMTVYVGSELLFTGTLIGVAPQVDTDRKVVNIAGYSRPGVLNDCTPPASTFPLEFSGMTLEGIARALAKPFGIAVIYAGPAGSAFERVAAAPTDAILSFLAGLAKQRSHVISSTPDGKLLIQQTVPTGNPVAVLRQGASPVMSVTPTFSPQEYYSHITGLESVLVGTAGSQYTVKNTHLIGVIRPMTFSPSDVLGGDLKEAVDAKVGRMYGNMAAYSVEVDTWRDPAGKMWAPNTTISLLAPDAMVYTPYEFPIRSVKFRRVADSETATLDLILPGAFSGAAPARLPWE